MRTASLLLSTLLLCGCTGPVKATWKGPSTTTIKTQWILVRDSDGRHVAEVDKYYNENEFRVWHNGAGYGEFETLEEAMHHAEEVSNRFGADIF